MDKQESAISTDRTLNKPKGNGRRNAQLLFCVRVS